MMKKGSGLLCLFGMVALTLASACSNDSLPTADTAFPAFEVIVEPNPLQGMARYGSTEWDYSIRIINRGAETLVLTGYAFTDYGIDKAYFDNADTRNPTWIRRNGGPWSHVGQVIRPRTGFQYPAGVIRSQRAFTVGRQERTYFATLPDGREITAAVTLELQ